MASKAPPEVHRAEQDEAVVPMHVPVLATLKRAWISKSREQNKKLGQWVIEQIEALNPRPDTVVDPAVGAAIAKAALEWMMQNLPADEREAQDVGALVARLGEYLRRRDPQRPPE